MSVNRNVLIGKCVTSFSIGYPVVTLGFGIKSYIGYRIRNRKQREVAKENEFFIQLLQLALPNDNPTEDEIIAQMQQKSEILHSDKFGDIDIPISSPIITQRIQQQRLLLATNLLNGIPEPIGSRYIYILCLHYVCVPFQI